MLVGTCCNCTATKIHYWSVSRGDDENHCVSKYSVLSNFTETPNIYFYANSEQETHLMLPI